MFYSGSFDISIYGNDIKENIQSNIKKNSDDTSLINTFHNQVVGIQVLN